MKKLAIITTHPIQYYAPVFKLLHERQNINIKVFYTWGQESQHKHDPGFNKAISWDLPLLEGYPYEWVTNKSSRPGSQHFKGIVNPDLINQIKDYAPDAILLFGWAYHSHLKILRSSNKIPIYFRGDSTLLNEQKSIKRFLRYIFLRWVYKHIDHAFYVGTNNKDYYKEYGLQESQLTFAPHSIDNKRFESDRSAEAAELRSSLNIRNEEILILFAGKFEGKKDPLLLLEAFLTLNKVNTHLVFTGNGVLEDELKLRAANNANIHFIDFQNQTYMPVIYQACDLFCLPSRGPGETWGLAVNEAMACGKAILLADKVGCAVDLVKPGQNGAIFKTGNLTDLVNNLKHLVSKNKSGLIDMGEHSRQIIADWNFEKQAIAIEKIVNETSAR
jgi:glycosyltransferase involved in cell wall biosynthesis